MISPRSAREIDWMARLVNRDVDRKMVETSPDYDASTIVDRAYERNLHGHYAPERLGDRL